MKKTNEGKNVQAIKKYKNNKGITLVALVITIIVLLILAGIVGRIAVGDNGIILKAKDSANKYNNAQDYELGIVDDVSKEYDSIIGGNWAGGSGSGNNAGGNNGDGTGGDNPKPPTGGSNLSQEEKDKLEDNGIKELEDDEITNENLKDNDEIKGVIEGEVPIPEGSDYVEGTKDTGVVIAFGDSEFVWVPVPNIDEMARLQGDGSNNYQGVLYNFSGTTATEMTNYGIGTSKNREPDVFSNFDASKFAFECLNNNLGTNYTAASQFLMDLQKDYNEMAESVKKYKGFFVGRYETSLDESKRAYSKRGVLPATTLETSGNSWYGLYVYQKKMATDNRLTSVKSHMIWGSNYDAMLRWGLKGAESAKVTGTGNAAHDLQEVYETGKETVLGKVDRINNIYDLEGNVAEINAEAEEYLYSNRRGLRGGSFTDKKVPSLRWSGLAVGDGDISNPPTKYKSVGSRLILYIK